VVDSPPDFCPYCGTEVEVIDHPTVFHCESCDEYVFHNPTPGGGTVVVDDDKLLLVEDFRSSDEWKIPEGRIECGESIREGVARELSEETGLAVNPDALVYLYDTGGQNGVGVYYAVERSATTGPLVAGSDATDVRFWTPEEFANSDQTIKEMPTPNESRSWRNLNLLLDLAKTALQRETRYSEVFAPHMDDLST